MIKLIILSMFITGLSCKKDAPVDYVIFSGIVANRTSDHIIVSNNNNSFRDTIAVSDNGGFRDTLKISKGSYLITHGKFFMRVYLEPTSNLNLNFDTKDFRNSISFSGEGAAINNYLQAKSNKEKEMTGSFEVLYSLDETAFKAKVNEIRLAMNQFLDGQQNISEDYKQKEKRNIGYEYINKLMGYERSRANMIKDPDFKVSNDFLPKLNEFDYNNGEDFEFSQSYKRLVSGHYKDVSKELAKSENLDEDIAYLIAISKSPNETIKNELLIEEVKLGISYTNDLEVYYHHFINASTDQKNNESITESYKKLRTVAKGKPSPKFYNYENNDGSKTSLDDLKGKYVYIDVWATWCGPCKQEIPFLKEIEKSYHGKKIEFLSVSIDKQSDRGKWKKMIADENLGGIQVLADNDWKSQFVKDYLIMGIPRFILLNPQGIIVNANAPRPSDKELIELFDELGI